MIPGPAPKDLYSDPVFREGLRILGSLGYTYDTWHYHHQNSDFIELAQEVPECHVVLDHFGTPLGEGIYRNHRKEIYHSWKEDMQRLARMPNVYVKLGGLAMPDNGFRWHQAQMPPSSDEIISQQEQYYLHMIDSFGPERCMFESTVASVSSTNWQLSGTVGVAPDVSAALSESITGEVVSRGA